MLKYKKQRDIVERKLSSIESRLEKLSGDKIDKNSEVYQYIVAQKVILREILREFDCIEL